MAIPISEYISITNRVVNPVLNGRDFSGLVFAGVAMKSGSPYKADYEGNGSVEPKVVSITRDEIAACFDDTDFIAYISRYFGYTGGTRRATTLHLAYIKENEGLVDAYTRVTKDFINFGAFTVYASDDYDDRTAMATANNGNEYGWTYIALTDSENQATDAAALAGQMMTHLTHADVEALAWYASVDYNAAGSSGTIDYKQFASGTPTIDTKAAKTVADNLKVNYIGRVQNYGNGMSFYQKGVNMDGTDLGVVRDACWISHQIASGYFALQTSVQKIPASYVGCAMVRNIVVGVATRAIENGSILIEKPLTDEQRAVIAAYTNNENAAEEVSIYGYYVDAKIVETNKVQYTLVYAKGDHINKVDGLHILI